jgi:threonine dehydrogenase-like Zn-dependent dehydrogenase
VRLPPALAASATPRILELLGEPAGRVLELGFAGIHAAPLRLAGFDVVVVEPDPAYLDRARERAGDALAVAPKEHFDAVVAPADADLRGIEADRVVLVGQDGAAWSSTSS